MPVKTQDYEIRSTQDGKITGTLLLTEATRGEANKYARDHSRYWKTRIVHVLAGDFPLSSFQKGEKIPLRDDLIEQTIGRTFRKD